MDLVVASLEAWDAVWRRNQHLAAGLLRRDPSLRVLFVEPSTDPLHAATVGKRPRLGRGLRRGPQVSGIRAESLWLLEPTKLLPRRIDRGVDERWAGRVRASAHRLGMTAPVLWVNDPAGATLVRSTSWSSLYDITDDWTVADRPAAEVDRVLAQEATLLERCHEVVVCSPALAAGKGATRSVTLIPNGVDTAAYRIEHPRPGDLPDGPVAVYVGTLHADRLDVDAVADTARGLGTTGTVVLVGPDLLSAKDRSRITSAGARVLGARPSGAVPAYLQHADVLLVPHLVTSFTDSLDPIKLYEYQAAGRPIVSTPVAGFRDVTDELVTIAPREAFAETTAAALAAAPPQGAAAMAGRAGRAGRADDADWSHRVAQMAHVLARVAGRFDQP